MIDPQFVVHPSVIEVKDGDQRYNIDIGYLYAMVAASIHQNGIWSDLDFDSLSPDLKNRFAFGVDPYGKPGSIRGIRFTRVPWHEQWWKA